MSLLARDRNGREIRGRRNHQWRSPVAAGGVEVVAGHADALPPAGHGPEPGVAEARRLRPDAGVEQADDGDMVSAAAAEGDDDEGSSEVLRAPRRRAAASILTAAFCRKSQDLVVWSWYTGSAKTETTPGWRRSAAAWSLDSRAANPEKPCLYCRTTTLSARCPLTDEEHHMRK